MGILRTAMMAIALASGAGGNGLEKTVNQETAISKEESSYITINGKTYRQRPPGAVCDPALYGVPIKEEPKQPIPKGPIYFAAMLAATIIAANTLRKKHDAIIEKYKPQRDFNFYNQRRLPVVDYEIEMEDREF